MVEMSSPNFSIYTRFLCFLGTRRLTSRRATTMRSSMDICNSVEADLPVLAQQIFLLCLRWVSLPLEPKQCPVHYTYFTLEIGSAQYLSRNVLHKQQLIFHYHCLFPQKYKNYFSHSYRVNCKTRCELLLPSKRPYIWPLAGLLDAENVCIGTLRPCVSWQININSSWCHQM